MVFADLLVSHFVCEVILEEAILHAVNVISILVLVLIVLAVTPAHLLGEGLQLANPFR